MARFYMSSSYTSSGLSTVYFSTSSKLWRYQTYAENSVRILHLPNLFGDSRNGLTTTIASQSMGATRHSVETLLFLG